MNEQLLTPENVSKRLQVNLRTVHAWLRAGRLKGYRVGRLWRIEEKELQAFLERESKADPGALPDSE